MRLQGKVAIVTGGAGGIGQAIALRLATEGADVAIADLNLQFAPALTEKISALGRRALALEIDVTRSQDTDRMVATTIERLGRIDILVNTAGGVIRGSGPPPMKFHELSEQLCDSVVDVNLKGVLNCCRSVAPHMIEQRIGRIINIASIAGIIGSAGMADYSAAKGGVIAFTRALAKELAAYGITVNAVSPGAIDHPATPKTGAYWERHKQTIYVPRFGQPEDIANSVAFLASDEASYITGQNLPVCGGRSLGGIVDEEW